MKSNLPCEAADMRNPTTFALFERIPQELQRRFEQTGANTELTSGKKTPGGDVKTNVNHIYATNMHEGSPECRQRLQDNVTLLWKVIFRVLG